MNTNNCNLMVATATRFEGRSILLAPEDIANVILGISEKESISSV